MDNQEIRSKLNDQNLQLLNEIEMSLLPVRFEEWAEDHYASRISKQEGCGIVKCLSDLHQAKIAHELLHIKTGFLLGDTSIMLSVVGQCMNPIAHSIITEKFCEDVVNQTEHYLFFEEYLSMNFNAIDFFEKIYLQREAVAWIDIFEKRGLGNKGVYTKDEVYSYIGVLILLSLYPIRGQYKQKLKRVSKAEPKLAETIKMFVDSIAVIRIDACDRNELQNAYMELANSIISWVNDNNIYL